LVSGIRGQLNPVERADVRLQRPKELSQFRWRWTSEWTEMQSSHHAAFRCAGHFLRQSPHKVPGILLQIANQFLEIYGVAGNLNDVQPRAIKIGSKRLHHDDAHTHRPETLRPVSKRGVNEPHRICSH